MIKRKNISTVMVVIAAIMLVIAPSANAEFALQLYGGQASTQNHNASVNLPDAEISGTHQNLRFDTAAVIGGRINYWLEKFKYIGFGVDISHFNGPDQKNQVSETDLCVYGVGCQDSAELIKKFNNSVNAIAFELMLRYPMLVSTQFPRGKFQPYLALGPSIYSFTMKDTGNFIPAGQSSKSTSWGAMAGAGMILYLTQYVGAFVEYQYSNFQVKDNFYNARVVNGLTLGETLGKATFNIHAVLAGVVVSIS